METKETKEINKVTMKEGLELTHEITSLVNSYDHYVEYIDDYIQWKNGISHNEFVLNKLRELGVVYFTGPKYDVSL
jgi:hypothetical protein